MTFDDVWIETDADDAAIWAAQHEFQLRQSRYEFYVLGGIAGIFRRAAESIQSLNRALRGIDADE